MLISMDLIILYQKSSKVIIINIFAVLIATIIQFFIGYLWYSKFMFGKIFLKNLGKTDEEVKMKPINIIGPLIIAFLSFLFFAIILDLLIAINLGMSMLLAVLIWVGFIATTNLYAVFFEERNFILYLLNVGYQLVGLVIGALIIGLWIL